MLCIIMRSISLHILCSCALGFLCIGCLDRHRSGRDRDVHVPNNGFAVWPQITWIDLRLCRLGQYFRSRRWAAARRLHFRFNGILPYRAVALRCGLPGWAVFCFPYKTRQIIPVCVPGAHQGTCEMAHNNGNFAWVFPPAGYLNFFSTALCYIGRHTLL